MEKRLIPEIRFKGFVGDWEEKKLGDVTKQIGDGLHSTPKYSDDGEYYFINGNNLQNGRIVIDSNTKQVDYNQLRNSDKNLDENTILMSINGTIGNIGYYNHEKVMLGKSCAYIISLESCKNFLFSFLQNPNVFKYYYKNLTGTTIKNLGLKAIRNTPILIPEIDEQEKIGRLFERLDQAIDLQRKVVEENKRLKQALLQKLFPKKGQKLPELRLKGFSGDWEEKKLGEIGELKSGTGFPEAEQKGEEGIPFFKVSDMNLLENSFMMMKSNNYVTENQVNKNKWKLIEGYAAIIFAKVGAAIMLNRKRLVKSRFLIDNNLMAFLVSSNYNDYFIKTMFDTINLPRYANVGPLPSYNASDIAVIKTRIPSLPEQGAIGNLFRSLDEKIAREEERLEGYKTLKKSLLQKMFV